MVDRNFRRPPTAYRLPSTIMIHGTELTPGLWALQNSDNERNTGVIFAPDGDDPVAAVDPGDLPVELDALHRFAEEMGRRVGTLIFTQEPGAHPAIERWRAAIVVTPTTSADPPLLPLPIPGWEVTLLSPGRIGVYHKKARLLLSGHLLQGGSIPNLSTGADAYLQALETLEALDVKLALAQQGPPAQGKREVRARLAADRDYTQNLVRHVVTAKASYLPLDRVLSVARDIYEDYPFLADHLRNLESVWNNLGR